VKQKWIKESIVDYHNIMFYNHNKFTLYKMNSKKLVF